MNRHPAAGGDAAACGDARLAVSLAKKNVDKHIERVLSRTTEKARELDRRAEGGRFPTTTT